MSQSKIAVVDYLDFSEGDEISKQHFIKAFGDSFANMGFAIVKNHGVSSKLREKLFDVSKRFFNLPDEIKKNLEDPQGAGQRGYVSKMRESAKDRKVPDLKEFYHIGQTVDDESDKITLDYPDNIWPRAGDVPNFRSIGQEVYETFQRTGENLLRAIALYLNLKEDYFHPKVKNGNSILRLLHYYPVKTLDDIPEGAVRAAPHGDINLITLLMGGSAAGLQAKSLQGEWIDVMPKEDEIVVNIGDMLERLTNGKLRSTTHQVVCPDPNLWTTSRISTPFFLHPRPDMDLSCLQSCVSAEKPKQFNNMTAGEFLYERLVELGLIKV